MSPYEQGVIEGRAWSACFLRKIAHNLANEAQVRRFKNLADERPLSHAAVALRKVAEDMAPLATCEFEPPAQRVERLAMEIHRAEIDDDARAYRPCAVDLGCGPC